MTRRGRPALLAVGAAVAASVAIASSRAAPVGSSLEVVKKRAASVVIGKVVWEKSQVTIDVEKVVLGHEPTGRIEVGQGTDATPDVKDGERALLVVDRDRNLAYAGSLLAGPTLEEGVLLLRGFSDRNAHVVEPGVVSLDQLVGYFKHDALEQQIDATLAFPDGKGAIVPSKTRIAIAHDPFARRTGVRGLPAKCLEGKPHLSLSSFTGLVDLRFSADCAAGRSPDLDRSLVLQGKLTGRDPTTGAFLAELVPVEPYVGEKDFLVFAGDVAIATASQAVALRLDTGAVWTWRLGKDLLPPVGPGFVASSFRSGPTSDTYAFGDAELEIAPGARTVAQGGHPRGVLELVDAGKLTKCEVRVAGRPARPCKASRKPTSWARIKRPKK
jgi:hypothetical protein